MEFSHSSEHPVFEMKKILFFRLGGLGDLLVTLPSIRLVRNYYPSSLISLVCHRAYGQILERTGVVDECFSQEARQIAPLFSGSLASGVEGDLRLQEFDRAVGWFQKRSSAYGLESVLSSIGMSYRFFTYDKHSQETISRNFFGKTREFADSSRVELSRFEDFVCLPLSSKQKKEGRQLLGEKHTSQRQKIIVIHPGSGSRKKCWPYANFLNVVQRLDQKNLRGVLVTGPAEERIDREMTMSDLPENWVWLHHPPHLRLAGLLSVSDFYLGNDSGITHLAAASGIKGLALFQKDLEPAWRPFGHISCMSETSVKDIAWEAVWERIEGQFLSG